MTEKITSENVDGAENQQEDREFQEHGGYAPDIKPEVKALIERKHLIEEAITQERKKINKLLESLETEIMQLAGGDLSIGGAYDMHLSRLEKQISKIKEFGEFLEKLN